MSKLRFGLVGEQISYTLSPRIFEWAFQRLNLDAEYRIYDLRADEAEAFIRSGEWDGLNITIPHKTLAWNCRDASSVQANKALATNCLLKMHGEIWAHNTDVMGCRGALLTWQTESQAIKRALIVGSGGAARAARVAVSETFPHCSVALASRDPERARERLRREGEPDPAVEYLTPRDASQRLPEFDLIIQATPVGSVRHPGLPLPEPLTFKRNARVLDMIYAPRDTAFMQAAQRHGARVQNGILMLITQAAYSLKEWTRQPIPVEDALQALAPEFGSSI